MPLLIDTGILYAYYDRRDAWHPRATSLLDGEAGVLVLPAPVIPEADYLLGKRLGTEGRFALYDDISRQVYLLTELAATDYERVFELNRQYADLKLGFVDAALVATAETLGIGRIATVDRRHFGAVTAKLPLELLP